MDVDKFKHVNDTFGHIVGDQALKLIAKTLKANVRSSDLVVRYGGDEFLVVIDNIEFTEALYLADKLRCQIVKYEIYIPEINDYIKISIKNNNNNNNNNKNINFITGFICLQRRKMQPVRRK